MFDGLGKYVRENKSKIGLIMGGMLIMGLLISLTECGGG